MLVGMNCNEMHENTVVISMLYNYDQLIKLKFGKFLYR